jgi:hypothetical protein
MMGKYYDNESKLFANECPKGQILKQQLELRIKRLDFVRFFQTFLSELAAGAVPELQLRVQAR